MTLLRVEKQSEHEADGAAPLVRYAEDAYTWARQQAALLRARRWSDLDTENLADEIADVAGREYDKLESALARVSQHLLTWDHQPERRGRSWALGIREHRRRVLRQLRKNPGLKGVPQVVLDEAFEDARDEALLETSLPEAQLPTRCPYAFDEIMGREIAWPDA